MRYVEAFSGSATSVHDLYNDCRRRDEQDGQKTHFVNWELVLPSHHFRSAPTSVLDAGVLRDLTDIFLPSIRERERGH